MLTGERIIEEKLITNLTSRCIIQQVGIDLELLSIKELIGVGFIFADEKTVTPGSKEISSEIKPTISKLFGRDVKGWLLQPGYYEIIMKQGCSIPANRVMKVNQRSSVNRLGSHIISGLYDPGYETENIGAFMVVGRVMFIEENSRLCQAYFFETEEVQNIYQGQYQRETHKSEE